MRTVSAIQQDIAIDTAACVERTKSSKLLGGFFYPRKKAEPECAQKARAKYANELATAQADEYDIKYATDTAFINELSGNDTNIWGILGLTFIFLIIVLLLI